MLAGAVRTSYTPEETVVRAVEAAVRSAGGGSGAPPRPIGMGLPGAAAMGAAEAAKVGGRLVVFFCVRLFLVLVV